MQFIRILLGSITFGMVAALFWLTGDIYGIGFGVWPATIHLFHIIALICIGLFVFSFILPRLLPGKRLGMLYPFINAIVGIVFYLFLGAVVLGMILEVGTWSPIQSFIITAFIFCISVSLAVIGMIQAKKIKITRHTVTLARAPESWHGKTAVLVSDTHFGLINHKKFSDKVVAMIMSLAPDFVLHAGDFYDGPQIDLAPIVKSWKELSKTTPVFYTSGNHEHYGNYQEFVESVRYAGGTLLLDSKVLYDGVQMAGIIYRGKDQEAEARKAFENLALDTTMPLILINHPPTFHSLLKDHTNTLMVSGHTHRGQFWPNNFIVRLIYKKYYYGIHTDGTLTAITSSGVGTAGPPMRLWNNPELVLITFEVK